MRAQRQALARWALSPRRMPFGVPAVPDTRVVAPNDLNRADLASRRREHLRVPARSATARAPQVWLRARLEPRPARELARTHPASAETTSLWLRTSSFLPLLNGKHRAP